MNEYEKNDFSVDDMEQVTGGSLIPKPKLTLWAVCPYCHSKTTVMVTGKPDFKFHCNNCNVDFITNQPS